jgi:hypothetical protein
MSLKWNKQLSHFVNSVAISNNGGLVAAGTYYYPYPGTSSNVTEGTFGTYCFDSAGTQLWKDEYSGNEGVYTVAASGDGQVVASAGLLSGGRHAANHSVPNLGLVRAFTANGTRLLDYSGFGTRVNSVALSQDGSVLAGVTLAGQLFVFSGQGTFPATPALPLASGPRLDMVAVHPSGQWLVACGWRGKVHLVTLNGGSVGQIFTWTAPNPGLKFLTCALAASSDSFVVGGRNKVYLFSKASMTAGAGSRYVDQFDTPTGGTSEDVRSVAISSDGKLISVVQNLGYDLTGLLLVLSNNNGNLTELRPPQTLQHNPNSTSIDSAGKFITVADGHPVGTPGTYYLFRASDGTGLWEFPTSEMSWPMAMSGDGASACGGSDNGMVYYFLP